MFIILRENVRMTVFCDELMKRIYEERVPDIFPGSGRGYSRNHLGVSINKTVLVVHNGKEYTLYTSNFSEGGIFIIKTNPFPIGSTLKITMPLDNGETITLQGVVVHVKGLFNDLLNSTPGMGVQFRQITDDQMMTLQRYKERLFAEDIFKEIFSKSN